MSIKWGRLLLLAGMALLVCATEASAWGGATHIKLAGDVLANLWVLPASVAALLSKHTWHYLYGNVAADIVLAKKLSRVKQICHHWTTGFSILKQAQGEEDHAFAYGYLSHLAADTVAHNKFLPRQFAVSRSTLSFGHLYWELRADSRIEEDHWASLRETLGRSYPGPRLLLEQHLTSTLLSFTTNKVVFERMNLLTCMSAWRKSVEHWTRISRWPLDDDVLGDYRTESLDRIVDVLTHETASAVLHDDPNGNSALAYAKAQRRQLRQMKRARMSHDHVVAEAAALHAPARFSKPPNGHRHDA